MCEDKNLTLESNTEMHARETNWEFHWKVVCWGLNSNLLLMTSIIANKEVITLLEDILLKSQSRFIVSLALQEFDPGSLARDWANRTVHAVALVKLLWSINCKVLV